MSSKARMDLCRAASAKMYLCGVGLAEMHVPGTLRHIIICGIERKAVFKDSADRDNFIDWLDRVIS